MTIQKLRDYIFKELVFTDDPAQFAPDDDLLEAGLDSMGIMRLVLFVEEEFNVILPDDELEPENLQSLNKIATWIQRHQ